MLLLTDRVANSKNRYARLVSGEPLAAGSPPTHILGQGPGKGSQGAVH